jgi:hypothetical protein
MSQTLVATEIVPLRVLASSKPPSKAELRAHPRVSLRGLIVLAWRDQDQEIRFLRVIIRNIASGGALVRSYRPLPMGAFVRIRSQKLFILAGSARVQRCSRRGLMYDIGLKFYKDLSARF